MRLLAPLPGETMRDFSLRVLRDNIVSLEMEPGKMYSEKELSSALDLSRTPMREALLQLAKIKIVEVHPHRGSAVALIDYDLVEEARFMREALECAVIGLVCQSATEDDLAALEGNVLEQQRALEDGDREALMRLDDGFHRLLFSIGNKMQCYDFVVGMTIHMDRVRRMALATVKEPVFVSEHKRMLEAVRARDGALAAELMRKHLSGFRVDESDLRRQYPQYFKEHA